MFSEPAIGSKFFGREDVLDLLNKRVLALKDGYRQNIALTGQCLSGKSSIILHFLHMIRGDGLLPIYIEVVREDFASFAQKFIATMLYNALTQRGIETSMDYYKLLSRSREIFPKTSTAIKQVITAIEAEEYDDAYAGLLGLTSVLKDETGVSCIVILDEFDNLEVLGIKNPFLSFGKVIMVQKDTMYIVTSSRNRAIKKILSEKLSLLFGNFEIVKVANFDSYTSLAFIESKAAGFDVDPAMKRFLIAFTDGNPFYLEAILNKAKELSLERMTSFIGREAIARAIVATIYKANGPIHQYLFNHILNLLDTNSRERLLGALIAITRLNNTQTKIARSMRIKPTEISKVLERLLELGLISKNGIFYTIDDGLLKYWLSHVYQARKEMLIDGAIDKDAIFITDIDTEIDAFDRDAERNVSERIAELFDQFSNELVQIDSKNMKLPHFTRTEIRMVGNSRAMTIASFKRNFWAAQVFDRRVNENDVVEYIRSVKSLGHKISNKIIIPLSDLDENAMLLAKELKISIWGIQTVNALMDHYGKRKIVVL